MDHQLLSAAVAQTPAGEVQINTADRMSADQARAGRGVAGDFAPKAECFDMVAPRSLVDLAQQKIAALGAEEVWRVSVDDAWCRVTPVASQTRTQGWKLHVAATIESAETVLLLSLGVLLEARCTFKFAPTLKSLALMNSGHYPRPGAGKFITVYPADDARAVDLAEALHRATEGLPGPVILSDRPYRTGSLVHYRYGAFRRRLVLSNDGDYRSVIADPGGGLVDDRREARFTPPPWARCPFDSGHVVAARASGGPPEERAMVLLKDRFEVRAAIRHANKGGVYKALDTMTGNEVVIKQARPHVAGDRHGRDARDVLRHESRLLDVVAPLKVAPRRIANFEHDGHLFLVQELLDGPSLRQWVRQRSLPAADPLVLGETLRFAERLAGAMVAVHEAGLILRDFNPNNVIVLEGEPRLIDLELAAVIGNGHDFRVGGTLGYAAPEQFAGAYPSVDADYYSLGATLCFLLTGVDPFLPEDRPACRTLSERLQEWLTDAAGIPIALQPLIRALMQERPGERRDAAWAQRFLRSSSVRVGSGSDERRRKASAPRAESQRELHQGRCEEALDGVVRHLVSTQTPRDANRLWPTSAFGATTDPCNVQHGAAGVTRVLVRACEVTGDERLRVAIAEACEWMQRRLVTEPRRPPGLYFGASGVAWTLYDAGAALGDDRAVERGLELAAELPLRWPNPDLTHGTAGIGLTQLHLWTATEETTFLQRAHGCADSLLADASTCATGLSWQVSPSFDSVMAGRRFHGFAHGTAGIGYFLLVLGQITGRTDCLRAALGAGESLLRAARIADGAATWDMTPETTGTPWVHWCNGSSGVGTFLVRLYQATGDRRFREMSEFAAKAVVDQQWHSPFAYCHGLAGNADYLLDIASALEDARYEAWAHSLARNLLARRVYRNGLALFVEERSLPTPADQPGPPVPADHACGLGGVLSFLLRLLNGGSRLWMVQPQPATLV